MPCGGKGAGRREWWDVDRGTGWPGLVVGPVVAQPLLFEQWAAQVAPAGGGGREGGKGCILQGEGGNSSGREGQLRLRLKGGGTQQGGSKVNSAFLTPSWPARRSGDQPLLTLGPPLTDLSHTASGWSTWLVKMKVDRADAIRGKRLQWCMEKRCTTCSRTKTRIHSAVNTGKCP